MPFLLACIWAFLAGASVALQVGGGVVLNDTTSPQLPHSAYVFVGCLAVGALWLMLLQQLQGGATPKRPKYIWSCCGGMLIAPAFVCTPAAALLGTQLTLTLLLLGMMSSAFLFDCLASRISISRYFLAGIILSLGAVAIQSFASVGQVSGNEITCVLYALGAVGAGISYSLQAKMNKRLALDLGSSARSAAFCNITAMIWGLPTCFVLVKADVPLEFRASDWWIWLLCGFQSAFYTCSLAELPKSLGYSPTFILITAGSCAQQLHSCGRG